VTLQNFCHILIPLRVLYNLQQLTPYPDPTFKAYIGLRIADTDKPLECDIGLVASIETAPIPDRILHEE